MFLKLGTIFLHIPAPRPPLFGPEKPPHEKKKMYHYYCNKIYKAHVYSKPCQAQVPTLDCNVNPGVVLIFATVSSVLGR